jgi:hypothetical protein
MKICWGNKIIINFRLKEIDGKICQQYPEIIEQQFAVV